jgi:hypothetical protein
LQRQELTFRRMRGKDAARTKILYSCSYGLDANF